MTSTRRMLLGTAAATCAVTVGGAISAQAADAMLKKAPAVQYVKICDMYGAGFFQIPGTQTCLQLRGSIQIDSAFQPTKDLVFVTHSGSGSYTASGVQLITARTQENWGYEVNVKPKFDARNETAWGTFRAYVELKGAIDAGNFNDPGGFPGPNPKESNTFSIFRAYTQWAGFTVGEADSAFSTGGYKDGDLQNVITGTKNSGFLVSYTWTPTGPGVPPKKGGAPVPDGWSVTGSLEASTKERAKANFGQSYNDLQLAGVGTVGVTDGPIWIPDVVGRVHYEADPPGKDPNFNDQWGIGTFQVSGVWHQIDTISTGGTGLNVLGTCATAPLTAVPCTPADGVVLHDHGWAVSGDLKIFTPMWGGAKIGSIAGADSDSIWFEAAYGVGALDYVGIGGTNGSLHSGDAYWIGGLVRDDTDGRFINNGVGGYTVDKEKAFSFNFQYHHIITDCTDPVNCWRFNIAYNYAQVTPGSQTQLTDWTLGGLGNAQKNSVTFNLIWGANRPPQAKPTLGELSFEVQYNSVTQTLPGNCNGGLSVCVAATNPGIYGVSANNSNWVGRLTATRSW
jgi:Porin subfamily